MDVPELEMFDPPRPQTATVVSLLVGAALILSYLAAYAVTNALVAADVISPWPRDRDPRPRWMGFGFFALITVFTVVGAGVRVLSRRQLHKIDEMETSDELLP
jgi:uncharacterized membrane-anchored protein